MGNPLGMNGYNVRFSDATEHLDPEVLAAHAREARASRIAEELGDLAAAARANLARMAAITDGQKGKHRNPNNRRHLGAHRPGFDVNTGSGFSPRFSETAGETTHFSTTDLVIIGQAAREAAIASSLGLTREENKPLFNLRSI